MLGGDNVKVCAVVDENGLVYYEIQGEHFKTEDYCLFLENLFAEIGEDRRCALFFDGLNIHKSGQAIKKLISDFGWLPILNVAYKPRQQPIELYFA